MSSRWPQVKRLGTAEALLARLDELGVSLPFADPPAVDALADPYEVAGRTVANRFAVLPMEGWDGTEDGRTTDLVRRRWARFGSSGAGLVWGGEAFAVRPDGRANPHQLCHGPSSADDLAELRGLLAPDQVAGIIVVGAKAGVHPPTRVSATRQSGFSRRRGWLRHGPGSGSRSSPTARPSRSRLRPGIWHWSRTSRSW